MPVYLKPCECGKRVTKRRYGEYECTSCGNFYYGKEIEVAIAHRNTNRGRSDKHENKTASLLKGRVTVGSGSFDFDKADVVLPEARIECKTTKKASKSVSLHLLHKIRKETDVSRGKMPILGLQFELSNGHNERYYVIDEKSLLMLIEALREQNEKHKDN